jgi:hypothetical protein
MHTDIYHDILQELPNRSLGRDFKGAGGLSLYLGGDKLRLAGITDFTAKHRLTVL